MTALEYFEDVSRAVREHREAELTLTFGPARTGAPRGPSSPSSGGPTVSRFLSDERAREVLRSTEATIGEALGRIGGLRIIFSRKADVLELHYVDLVPWDGVASSLRVSRATAMRWRDELLDWVDTAGWARTREGVGFAEA